MRYLFIHGLGQNPSSWDKTISFMPDSIHAQCPDLAALLDGKEATYANLYSAFSGLCEEISEPLNLCGLSLGGVLALNYAIDYPGKVRSLTLIATPYKMPKTLFKIQNIIFRLMPKSTFHKMGFQKKDFIQLANSMVNLDFSERIKDILCAVLVICADKDYINKKPAKDLSGKILGAKFALIEDAGHEVNVDNPQKLAAELEMFFNGI